MKLISLVSLVLSLNVWAADDLKTECFDQTGWSYCVSTTAGSTNPDVLYHFHGKTLNARAWSDDNYYTGQVRQNWREHGFAPPTVVSLSLGPIWLLVEKNASPYSGQFELVVEKLIPLIEQKLGGVKGKRMLIGESMGGFNATQVALKTDGMFERVAILCPPMTLFSPFGPASDVEEYIKRTGADRAHVEELLKLSKTFMADQAAFEKASPLGLVKTVSTKRAPKLYVSCGKYDAYGFFEGAEAFSKIAQGRGLALEWRPIWGGHCATDIESVAAFLSK